MCKHTWPIKLILILITLNNFAIVSNISRWTLAGLKQLSFTWFLINYFLENSVRLKSDHQDLLRSVCFQKLYFHCSSAEEWSSSHIFWGALISSSLNQHWIALHYMFGSFQSHIIGDTERRFIFRSFYVSICCTVIKITLIYITSIRISS